MISGALMNAERKRPQLHSKVVRAGVIIIIIVFEVPSVAMRDDYFFIQPAGLTASGILNESACGDVVSFLY